MSNHVFVLDSNRKPLTPCKPGVARSLLNAGKASVFRRYPFTIILNKEVDANPEPLELKLDPGSKVSGMALKQGNQIIFAAELQHRGEPIKKHCCLVVNCDVLDETARPDIGRLGS
jgi:hypothetical protein